MRSDEEIKAIQEKIYSLGEKKCPGCKNLVDLQNFAQSLTCKDGLRTYCRVCVVKRTEERSEKLKARSDEEIKAIQDEFYENGKKECCSCGALLPLPEFNPNITRVDGMESFCQVCQEEKKYEKGKLYRELKENAQCENCGVSNPEVLHYVNIDPTKKHESRGGKRTNPSKLGVKQFEKDLENFKFLCGNCHRDEIHGNSYNTTKRQPSLQSLLDYVNKEKKRIDNCQRCEMKVEEKYWRFDFDHLDPITKITNIATMVTECHKYTIDDIRNEISKTQLLCHNCHMIVTNLLRKE